MSVVLVAYHAAAEREAGAVRQRLTGLGYTAQSFSCDGTSSGALARHLSTDDTFLVLLLSEDLLRSLGCLQGLRATFTESHAQHRALALRASAQPVDEDSVPGPLPLGRVSDVIRHMNYWQTEYLRLRRSRANAGDSEVSAARVVSQEIGEFLKLVRAQEPMTVSEFLQTGEGQLRSVLGVATGTPLSTTAGVPQARVVEEVPDGVHPSGTPHADRDADSDGVDAATDLPSYRPADAAALGAAAVGSVQAYVGTALEGNGAGEPDTAPAINGHPLDNGHAPSGGVAAPPSISLDEIVATAAAVGSVLPDLTPSLNPPGGVPLPTTPEPPATGLSEGVALPYLSRVVDVAASAATAVPQNVASEGTVEATPDRTTTEKPDAPPLSPRDRRREQAATHLLGLFEHGSHSKGFAFGRDALAADPTDHKLRYYLAVGLLEDESAAEAEGLSATRELKLLFGSPFEAAARVCLGERAYRLRNYGAALKQWQTAYRIDHRIGRELPYRIGALYQDELDRAKRARKYLKLATKHTRDHGSDAWYRLGQIAAAQRKWKRAARNFKAAVSLDKRHPFAAYDLARLYLERGRPEKANNYFLKAVAANAELDTEHNRAAFAPEVPEAVSEGFGRYVSLRSSRKTTAPVPSPSTPLPRPSRGNAPGTAPVVDLDAFGKPLTVLITGATSGIGLSAARQFAAAGHRLLLTGRRVERLREVSAELATAHDSQVRVLSFDVTDLRATNQLLSSLPDDWLDIDVLINNAGKARGVDPVHEGQIEDWEEMIDTNVKGLLYMSRLITPGMVERGRGHVINVCSTAGHEVYAGGAVYCATKHAVDALTRGMRLDLHKHNIRVSQVSPAAVEETEFSEVRFGGDVERAERVYEGFQPLRARDVARTLLFVAEQPAHVNVQDVIMLATQQANSTTIARTGR